MTVSHFYIPFRQHLGGAFAFGPNMKGDIDKRNVDIGANKHDDEWS